MAKRRRSKRRTTKRRSRKSGAGKSLKAALDGVIRTIKRAKKAL